MSPNDSLGDAATRGARAKRDLLAAGEGGLSSDDVAARLGRSTAEVADLVRQRALLAVPTAAHELQYPACQFAGTQPVPGLATFLRAFPRGVDPWVVLNVLLGPSTALGGRRPLDALHAGDVADAAEVAAAAVDHPD